MLAAMLVAISLQAQTPSPAAPARRSTLATARIIYIASQTTFLKQAEMEKELLKHKEFEDWGLELTRDPKEADILLEVKRAAFQSNFPYSVIDRRTKVVLAAGEVNSLAGTVAGKISSQLIEKMKAARERASPRP